MEYYSVMKRSGWVFQAVGSEYSGDEVGEHSIPEERCGRGREAENSLEAGRRLVPDAMQAWGAC